MTETKFARDAFRDQLYELSGQPTRILLTCRISPCAVKIIASRPSDVNDTCSTLTISIKRFNNCSSFNFEYLNSAHRD